VRAGRRASYSRPPRRSSRPRAYGDELVGAPGREPWRGTFAGFCGVVLSAFGRSKRRGDRRRRPEGGPGREVGAASPTNVYGKSTGLVLVDVVTRAQGGCVTGGRMGALRVCHSQYASTPQPTLNRARAALRGMLTAAGEDEGRGQWLRPRRDAPRTQMVELIKIQEASTRAAGGPRVGCSRSAMRHLVTPGLLATSASGCCRPRLRLASGSPIYVSGGMIRHLPGPDEGQNHERRPRCPAVMPRDPDGAYDKGAFQAAAACSRSPQRLPGGGFYFVIQQCTADARPKEIGEEIGGQ